MFLQEPAPTRADLNFTLFGFPVRVHPMFWLVTALMAWRPGQETPPQELVIWIIAVFFCIVVHELGHAFLARRYGASAHIVLYSFGGLAISHPQSRYMWERVAISFAGPAAGFLFAGLTMAIIAATGREVQFDWYWIPFRWKTLPDENLNLLVLDMTFINCYWGLFNLLPIYPLDGGQIARNLFTHYDWRDGLRKSQIVSVIVAVGLAVYLFQQSGGNIGFQVMMLGFLAFQNFQEMRGGGYGNPW